MKYILPLSFLILFSCQPQSREEKVEEYQPPAHHSTSLSSVLEAHGGYQQWELMQSLSYIKGEESTVTNLKNRKIRLESPEQTIGFDGENVWVTPDSVDAGRARFYHNLYFYFYAMPFVVGDPGAFYEDVPERDIDGKNYKGIKVSYGEGVGDAPDDNYIIWYDPETYSMEWLMYTVTYRSSEPSDRYSLIRYPQWSDFEGLSLPTAIQWYHFKEDTVGEMRNEVAFENISISMEAPDEALFEMPDGAQIAPR